MPFPPANYYACFPIQNYLVNKDTGAPLSGGVIYFFEDEARTVPKNVYIQQQQPDNSYLFINIGSQVTLSSVGTTQYLGTDCIIFLYPFDSSGNEQLYYLEVFSSDGILQLTREAYPPGVASGLNPSTSFISSENVVSNPQFAEVLFAPTPAAATTFAIAAAGTYEIAPDWSVITPSSGTLIVKQVAVTDTLAPGLPAFALDISVASFSGPVILSQKISMSPRLLEDGFVSGSFIAQAITTASTVTMNFVPSNPAMAPVLIKSGTATLGGFALITGSVATPVGAEINSDAGNVGYVQVQFVIQNGAEVILSCVQLLSVAGTSTIPEYIQESTPRQQDHLFHYWQSKLNYKPIPSYLTAWDFPLNPAQLGAYGGPVTLGGTNLSQYIWDQTILFSAVDNAMTWARNSSTNGLTIGTGSTSAFAIIQYLSAAQAREILSQRNSVKLKGLLSTGAGTLAGNVSLWWTTASFPNINPSNCFSLVSGVDAVTAVPSVGGGSYGTWTQVPNLYNNGAFTLSTTDSEFSFSGFDSSASMGATTATGFAIVVSFGGLLSTQAATIDYCSLVGGDIATRPAPQAPDEVLRECQYYYEKSSPLGQIAAYANAAGSLEKVQSTGGQQTITGYMNQSPFDIRYVVNKRTTPTTVLYNVSAGTSASVDGYVYIIDNVTPLSSGATPCAVASFWTPTGASTNGIYYEPTLANFAATPVSKGTTAGHLLVDCTAFVNFHYEADARIGIV